MTQETLYKLNMFLLELDNKYDINSGACALVASVIAKYCEDHNIVYKTKVYYYEDECICPWHYSLVIDNIEINPSTYEYQEWEHEITQIENNLTSKELKHKYQNTSSEYWKIKNNKIVTNLLEDFLNNIRI